MKREKNKSIGSISKIFNILENIYFGKHFFQIALILRESILLSSMLFSSEAMVNITKKELKILSQIDANFLRKLAGVGKGCPTELLYLIFGMRPIEYIIKCRRLNFLHYILKQNNESLIYKVFQAILENPVKNDWVSSAKKTIEEFNLNMTFSEIKHIDTKKFKFIVRQKSF